MDVGEAVYRIEILKRWNFSDEMERYVDHRNMEIQKRGKEIQIVIGEQKQLLTIDLITKDSLIITPITEEDEFTRVLLAKNS